MKLSTQQIREMNEAVENVEKISKLVLEELNQPEFFVNNLQNYDEYIILCGMATRDYGVAVDFSETVKTVEKIWQTHKDNIPDKYSDENFYMIDLDDIEVDIYE